MGAVLAAERTDDGRPAAIKVLWLGQGVDWKAAELFERSTQVLSDDGPPPPHDDASQLPP
jgi:hypothetical protein